MAITLRDTIVTKNFNGTTVDFIMPTSTTNTETVTFSLNNSDDNILIVADASMASPGNYTITFEKGSYPSAKAPAQIVVQDGISKVIAIDSSMIEKKNSTATFSVNSSNGPINVTGIRFAIIKRRFVTNN